MASLIDNNFASAVVECQRKGDLIKRGVTKLKEGKALESDIYVLFPHIPSRVRSVRRRRDALRCAVTEKDCLRQVRGLLANQTFVENMRTVLTMLLAIEQEADESVNMEMFWVNEDEHDIALSCFTLFFLLSPGTELYVDFLLVRERCFNNKICVFTLDCVRRALEYADNDEQALWERYLFPLTISR